MTICCGPVQTRAAGALLPPVLVLLASSPALIPAGAATFDAGPDAPYQSIQQAIDASTEVDLLGYISDRHAGTRSTTANRRLTVFRRYFRWALRERRVSADPTLRLISARQPLRAPKVLSEAQVEALLAALDERHRLIWSFAVYTGLRKGELRALRWENIDLEAGILKVEHSYDPVAGLVSPKSESGRRRVPIPQVLAPELVAHMARQPDSLLGETRPATGS